MEPSPSTRFSERRLAKHQFARESELMEALCLALEASPSLLLGSEHRGDVFSAREWQLGAQIADLVLAGRQEAPQAWHNALADFMKLDFTDRFVLARIIAEPLTMDGLLKAVHAKLGTVERVTDSLEQRGLVFRDECGRFRPTEGWTTWLPSPLHFVEGKMEDWREAILQAVYYRRFGHAASIALPASFRGHEGVLAGCLEQSVGLILVAPCGTPEIVLPAVHSEEAPRLRGTQVEVLRKILRRTNGYQTGMPVADLQLTDLPLWRAVDPNA